jgi:hypothetical protein
MMNIKQFISLALLTLTLSAHAAEDAEFGKIMMGG